MRGRPVGPQETSVMFMLAPPPLAHEAPVSTPAPSAEQMVGALHTAFGDHHVRAVHAKGVMAEGVFTPAPEARTLTKADLFRRGDLPILVRFSDFTGIPDIPDTDGGANPRGFAVKFMLKDGQAADVVTHSFNGFPAENAGEFRQLLIAIGGSGPGAAKPTPVDAFLATHPVAKTFLTTQKPPPVSYATLSYFGVNAFSFTCAEGKVSFVRYRFVPVKGDEVLSAAEVAAKGPNYLSEELPGRLAAGEVVYEWYAQVAEPGDVIDNPSIAWPDSRRQVKLGTLRIQRMAADPAKTDKATIFRPAYVTDGIATADPMLEIRRDAYPISFGARQ